METKMIAVAELTGAQLDYWTARAEGIPAEQLSIRQVPRTDNLIVVWTKPGLVGSRILPRDTVLNYSTDWANGGPLQDKHIDTVYRIAAGWHARTVLKPVDRPGGCPCYGADGDTPLQAICRAIVRSLFGEQV